MTPTEALLPVERLHELFDLDVETGILTWKPRPEQQAKWNTRYVGKRAGCFDVSDGYRKVTIDRKLFREHRIIWAMVHGRWPKNEIDHRHGKRDDNRPSELREATNAEQTQNRRLSKNNSSGHLGVFRDRGVWRAHICIDDKRYSKTFPTIEEAVGWRRQMKQTLHKFNPEERITI